MTWGEGAQLIVAFSSVAGLFISWRNGRKLKEVKEATNGMSHRLEVLAEAKGNAEGRAEGKAEEKLNPT